MAARQLARLRAQQEAASRAAGTPPDEDSEGDISPIGSREPPPFNPFDLLDDDERPATPVSEESEAEAPTTSKVASSPSPIGPGGKSKKSKKKKGKGKGKGKDAAAAEPQEDRSEDIDELLEEVERRLPGTVPLPQASTADDAGPVMASISSEPLLVISSKRLRPDEEMRRIFGSRIVDADDGADGGGGFVGAGRRVRRLAARGALRRMGPQLKKGLLITPKDHWPRLDGGLSMEKAGLTEQGHQLFRYTYSSAYQGVQTLFEQCQETFNPNNIVGLLEQNPYHIDSLLTMGDLYRSTNQHEYAEEMLSRCLYALEMAWHPSFNPTTGTCRLSFREASNRPLFVALNRYIQSLSRRGLHATALEVAKLTLSLDPEDDPVGLLTCIDYYALRAQQYSFLIRLVEEMASESSFPNLAFARPMALFYQSKADGLGDEEAANIADTALELLQDAVLLHPWALKMLLEKLKDQGVGRDAEWASILRAPLFNDAGAGGNGSLNFLVKSFVERSHPLWKVPEVLAWLKRACSAAINTESDFLDNWEALREELFPPGAPNEYQHLLQFVETTDRLPAEEMQQRAAAQQPPVALDPEDHEMMGAIENVIRARAEGRQIRDEDLRRMGPVAAFLRTLLPWVEVEGQNGPQAEGAEGELADLLPPLVDDRSDNDEDALGGGDEEEEEGPVLPPPPPDID